MHAQLIIIIATAFTLYAYSLNSQNTHVVEPLMSLPNRSYTKLKLILYAMHSRHEQPSNYQAIIMYRLAMPHNYKVPFMIIIIIATVKLCIYVHIIACYNVRVSKEHSIN